MVRTSYILIFFLLLIAFGCSSTETIIRDKKIEMIVPAVKDSTPGTFKEFPKVLLDSLKRIFAQLPDSAVIEGTLKLPNSDKPGNLKYRPKTNDFVLDIPPQKVDTTITDTTSLIVKKETTTPEKFGYATIGIIVFVIIAIVVFLGFKFKWV
jgi:hypothetical protein